MSEWQPIETAPKDGTMIDVWAGDDRVTDAYWSMKKGRWVRDEYELNYGYVPTEIIVPAYWMPLPSPPLTEAQSQERT